MSLVLTVTDAEISNGLICLYGSVVFSGSYTTGGETMDLTKLIGQISAQGIALDSTKNPLVVYVSSVKGGYGTGANPGSGGYYEPVQGASPALWKLQLFDTGGTERAQAAYPGGVTGDVVTFEIRYRRPQ